MNDRWLAAALALAVGCTSPAIDPGRTSDAGVDARADAPFVDAPATDAPGRSLRILFIGNSYTFVNDMPTIVRDALASAPEIASVEVESVTVGSATLAILWNTSNAQERIRLGAFTHVVVQGQSTEVGFDPDTFTLYAQRFAQAAHAAGSAIVFYETWPRRAGDALYSNPSWGYPCPSSMLSLLQVFYGYEAAMGMGAIAPVGNAWMAALAARPNVDLYYTDGSHPTLEGSWLAAAVFVCTIAHRSAHGLTVPASIPPADAAFLVDMADRACANAAPPANAGITRPTTTCADAGPDA